MGRACTKSDHSRGGDFSAPERKSRSTKQSMKAYKETLNSMYQDTHGGSLLKGNVSSSED